MIQHKNVLQGKNKMKIVFCYYDNINFDARAQEELNALASMGEVTFVSYSEFKDNTIKNVHNKITKKRNYLDFLVLSRKVIKNVKPDLLFLHDNYCAALVKYAKKIGNVVIAYDMSELYIGRNNANKLTKVKLYDWFLRKQEYDNLQCVDIIISANLHRGLIAKGYFGLELQPVIFDNIHRIDENYDEMICKEKYSELFDKNKFVVLYAGGLGYPDERDTSFILEAANALGNEIELIIAGKKSEFNPIYDKAMEANTNIHYIGMIPRAELKYLYRHANINVVTFSLTTINNIYCASGKLYEGLFEGLPIVCSENPPMAELCESKGVGVIAVNHDYADAIRTIMSNIDEYKENVKNYINSIGYENRVLKLKEAIQERYEIAKQKCGELNEHKQ